jgi:hypothetical protein
VNDGAASRPVLSKYIEIIFGWLGWNMTRNWLGQFAWFEVNFPAAIYVVFIALLGGSLLLSSAHLARAIAKRNFDLDLKIFSFLFLTVLAVLLGAFVYQYAVADKFGIFIQGRYTLYVLPLVYLCVGMILSSALCQAKRRLLECYRALVGHRAIFLGPWNQLKGDDPSRDAVQACIDEERCRFRGIGRRVYFGPLRLCGLLPVVQ